MNTYQALRQEGRQEGSREKARLIVLRGRFRGNSAEILADLSELQYSEVDNMLKGYEEVYKFWSDKKVDKNSVIKSAHLADSEVRYLLNLFNEKMN